MSASPPAPSRTALTVALPTLLIGLGLAVGCSPDEVGTASASSSGSGSGSGDTSSTGQTSTPTTGGAQTTDNPTGTTTVDPGTSTTGTSTSTTDPGTTTTTTSTSSTTTISDSTSTSTSTTGDSSSSSSSSGGSSSTGETSTGTSSSSTEPAPTSDGSGTGEAGSGSGGAETGTPTTDGPAATSSTGSTGETTGGDAIIIVEGLSHPESIAHDLMDDVYFISNINGAPDGVDDNGFISRVLPDGTIDALAFIDGAAADVSLDAPKGMVIIEDTLWVADITRVRKFDRVSGAALGEVVIDGSLFLNDLAADAAGHLYISDTGANILYTIDLAEKPSVLLASPAIFGPNGLFVHADRLYLATYDDTKIFSTALGIPVALPEKSLDVGQLDGLVRLSDGDWLVSSWALPGVLRVAADFGEVTTQIADLSSPADIAVDEGRKRILIPRLLADRAEFHPY